MRRAIAWVLGVLASFATSFAFAQAVATSVTGNVTAQMGTGPSRVVIQGDTVRSGETVSTAAASAVVLRYPDGQVTSLTQNSRFHIQAYEYNPQTKSGNILLDLLAGGVRTVSGLIAANNPSRFALKAGSTTIGIRGTDFIAGFDPRQGTVVAVISGSVIVTWNGKELATLTAGQAIFVRLDGTFIVGTIDSIYGQLPPGLLVAALAPFVNAQGQGPYGGAGGTPGPNVPGGSGGGGAASVK